MSVKYTKKAVIILAVVLVIVPALSITAFAAGAGDVAGAVTSTWNAAKAQIKSVVNNVVFPVVDLILAAMFFVKVGTAAWITASTVSSSSLLRRFSLRVLFSA